MALEILTKQDLAIFKSELIAELSKLFNPSKIEKRQWLKSYEVRELLGISHGTLQNMRINGTIEYTKVGGLIFYNYDDILKLMEKDKKNTAKR